MSKENGADPRVAPCGIPWDITYMAFCPNSSKKCTVNPWDKDLNKGLKDVLANSCLYFCQISRTVTT